MLKGRCPQHWTNHVCPMCGHGADGDKRLTTHVRRKPWFFNLKEKWNTAAAARRRRQVWQPTANCVSASVTEGRSKLDADYTGTKIKNKQKNILQNGRLTHFMSSWHYKQMISNPLSWHSLNKTILTGNQDERRTKVATKYLCEWSRFWSFYIQICIFIQDTWPAKEQISPSAHVTMVTEPATGEWKPWTSSYLPKPKSCFMLRSALKYRYYHDLHTIFCVKQVFGMSKKVVYEIQYAGSTWILRHTRQFLWQFWPTVLCKDASHGPTSQCKALLKTKVGTKLIYAFCFLWCK